MLRAADLLTVLRLGAAVLLPGALADAGILAPVLWFVAAGTDILDGRLARRTTGGSVHGAILDPVADVAFVLGGLVTAAVLGLVRWVVPGSVALAVASYAMALLRSIRRGEAGESARSRVGHAAGIVNYACVGVVVGSVTWPTSFFVACLPVAAAATVVVNLAAVVERSARRQLTRRTA
jgi:CDP-diacylglycerol--glycerol-3-phosphate 3-phosphatidyltransferase